MPHGFVSNAHRRREPTFYILTPSKNIHVLLNFCSHYFVFLLRKITGRGGWGAQLRNGTYCRMTASHKGERWPDEKNKPMMSLQNKIPGKPRSHHASTTAALRRGDKGIKRPVKQPPRTQRTQTKAAIVPTRLRFTPVHSVNSLFICALIIPTHEAGRANQHVRKLPDIPG